MGWLVFLFLSLFCEGFDIGLRRCFLKKFLLFFYKIYECKIRFYLIANYVYDICRWQW